MDTIEQLNRMLDHSVGYVKMLIAKGSKGIQPFVAVLGEGANGEIVLIPPIGLKLEDKPKELFTCGATIATLPHDIVKPKIAMMVSEAWTRDPKDMHITGEIVGINGMSIDGKTCAAMIAITRKSKKDRTIILGEITMMRAGEKSALAMVAYLLRDFWDGYNQMRKKVN